MIKRRQLALAAAVAGLSFTTSAFGGFSVGNLVVYRLGDGSGTGNGALVNTGSPIFLDEFTTTGTGQTPVTSVGMPTVASGNNKPLIGSGTATSEGMLSRSDDGRFLVVPGYGRTLGGAGSISGTTATNVARVVGMVDQSGGANTSTALTDWADANNPRSASSTDGSNVYVSGGAGGIRYALLGVTNSTQINTGTLTLANYRQLSGFGGQLYASTSSGTPRVNIIGMGFPTTAGQNTNPLASFASTASPNSFFLADLDGTVAGLDTMYIADDVGGLLKFSFDGTNWNAKGAIGVDADDYRGLVGVVNGQSVTLYSTRKGGGAAAGGGELISLTDASGFNATITGTALVLATAPANESFRGVAFAPVPEPATGAMMLLAGAAVVGKRRRRKS